MEISKYIWCVHSFQHISDCIFMKPEGILLKLAKNDEDG